MNEMDYEVVPALAQYVEARMTELKLTPTLLKKATGLSGTVLDHVRKGYRKKYGKALKWKVCEALQWSSDSIDRILAGGEPVPVAPAAEEPRPLPLADQLTLLTQQVAQVVSR